MKSAKRKYQPKGTRRAYKNIRIDIEVHERLQTIADELKIPLVEVMRLAVEKFQSETANESE